MTPTGLDASVDLFVAAAPPPYWASCYQVSCRCPTDRRGAGGRAHPLSGFVGIRRPHRAFGQWSGAAEMRGQGCGSRARAVATPAAARHAGSRSCPSATLSFKLSTTAGGRRTWSCPDAALVEPIQGIGGTGRSGDRSGDRRVQVAEFGAQGGGFQPR